MLSRYETAGDLRPKWDSQQTSMTPCGKNRSSMGGGGEDSRTLATSRGKKESRSRSPGFTEGYSSVWRSREFPTLKESPLKLSQTPREEMDARH